MKVLAIEDDFDQVKLIRLGLSAAGIASDVADTVAKGVDLMSRNRYDIVVLDLMLPDGDGKELLAKMRTDGDRTPVIVLSALASTADRIAGLSSGADDYMVKPFSPDELVARIKAVLRRSAHECGSEVAYRGLVFDSSRDLFYRNGRELNLSGLERRLLEVFIRNPRKWMSSGFLLKEVWNFEAAKTNVVEAKIYAIRRELNARGEPELIETKRGLGYALR